MRARLSALILAAICLPLQACLCDNDMVQKVTSSDGLLVATSYVRNCGAMSDYATTVNLQSSKEQFDANQERLFIAKGKHDVVVEWKGPKQLHITCVDCKRNLIYREVAKAGDVDIDFDVPEAGGSASVE